MFWSDEVLSGLQASPGSQGRDWSGESSSEDIFKITPEQATQRFEHYELLKGEDGKPLELGRGAMGITYKAYDIDLQCPVALKVIKRALSRR